MVIPEFSRFWIRFYDRMLARALSVALQKSSERILLHPIAEGRLRPLPAQQFEHIPQNDAGDGDQKR